MKLLIDVKDDKSPFIMELLGNFEFVKMEKVRMPAARVLEDISEGVEELKRIEAGTQKGVLLSEFLHEL